MFDYTKLGTAWFGVSIGPAHGEERSKGGLMTACHTAAKGYII
jgi:hypothetical protein